MAIYGYIRVSTAEHGSGGSLEAQRDQINGYAMMKGWKIGETFVEPASSESLAFADRPEGHRLLATAKKGDEIVTARFDRMFHSAADALEALEDLKTARVGVHVIDLGGEVTGDGTGKLLVTILSALVGARGAGSSKAKAKSHDASSGVEGAGKKTPAAAKEKPPAIAVDPAKLAKMREMRATGAGWHKIGSTFGMEGVAAKRLVERAALAEGEQSESES